MGTVITNLKHIKHWLGGHQAEADGVVQLSTKQAPA